MRTLRLLKRCAMFLALVAVRSIHGSPLPAQVANVPKETVTKAQVTCILGSRPASILSMVPTILTAASANSISTCCPIAMLNESFFEYLQSQVISLLTISKRCSKVRVYRGSIFSLVAIPFSDRLQQPTFRSSTAVRSVCSA